MTLPRSTLIGWIVMGVIVALLPIQAGWYLIRGSEPYPALSQPAFNIVPGATGRFTGQSTSLAIITTSGSVIPLPTKDFFAIGKNQAPHVVAALEASPHLEPDSREAVLAELGKFVPVHEIAALRIDVQRRTYQPVDNTRRPTSGVQSIVIDLRDSVR